MGSLKIRGLGCSKSVEKGATAERAATSYFRNRGHTVVELGHLGVQHDLEVSGIGRVQVKSTHLACKGREEKGKERAFKAFLGDAKSGHYAVDAFDVLCLVWTPRDKSYVVCIPTAKLVSERDPRRMKSTFQMGATRFRNMMEPVELAQVATLW